MIYQSPQNPFSHLTAKQRTQPSFPIRQLVSRGLIKGRVLDFGAGHGIDVTYLKECGIEAEGFDPYYAPNVPEGRYDTIICTYVLNVLLPLEQAHVLMAVSELLMPSGNAYFTVRRDIQDSGYRTHAIYKEQVYQCNVLLPFQSILLTKHCEIYCYRHITQQKPFRDIECEFCNPDRKSTLITESATAYAVEAKFPITPGHSLIVPKPHVPNFLVLSERNKMACWFMIERFKSILERQYNPVGFRLQIDLNPSKQNDISHSHIHVIPLYTKEAPE